MSQNLPSPSSPEPQLPQLGAQPGGLQPFEPLDADLPEEGGGASIQRYIDALLRAKWAILAIVVLGTAAGFLVAQRIRPMYIAQATIWIQAETGGRRSAPRQSGDDVLQEELLQSTAWIDLLKSYEVMIPVVTRQRLYLDYAASSDSALFADFALQERFRPGAYRLEIAEDGRSWELHGEDGVVVDRGVPGDSVGHVVGFTWHPPANQLGADRTVEFTVWTPADAATALRDRIVPELPEEYGNFMSLSLTGGNPTRTAATLNAVTERFVEVATDLKRAKLVELTRILEEQVAHAQTTLEQAEMEHEAFRVATITLPTEASPVTPGLEETQDPAFDSFFEMRIERDQLDRDIAAIRGAVLAQAEQGETPVERLWAVESVQESSDLKTALEELTDKQAELRMLRTRYTDQHAEVRRLSGEVTALESEAIPSLASTLLTQLSIRAQDLDSQIGSATRELRQIPPRMIEEARLSRRVAIAEELFTTRQSRYESARLAAVSSVPDLRILDAASVPNTPTNSSAKLKIIGIALLASFGLGIAGALVADRLDKRVRYPNEVTTMGLPILGAVQLAPQDSTLGSETVEQVVEAFRELRLAIMHAYGSAGPLMLTITSPGSGDGKSFVSSNLALAFGDLGLPTLVIDGDIRRGTLHHVLGGSRKPGLTDLLAGEVSETAAIQKTQYPNVDFIGAGAWRRTGPELLASPAMRVLLSNVRSRYKVILVDSSPLGAGVDPFVLGTVTGSLLMVLRTGATDKDLAGAKLDVLQRLPIRILGAVMNGVPSRGAYRYYSYLSNYQLPPGHGEREPAEV